MATTIDFSGIDFDSASLELTIANTLGAVSALLEGPDGNSIKVPVAGDFVWTAADLLPTGWTWGASYNIKFTMPDATTTDFPFVVGGQPKLRVQSVVDGVVTGDIDEDGTQYVVIPWTSILEIVGTPVNTLHLRFTMDSTIDGAVCSLTKEQPVPYGLSSTVASGYIDILVLDTSIADGSYPGLGSSAFENGLISLIRPYDFSALKFAVLTPNSTVFKYMIDMGSVHPPVTDWLGANYEQLDFTGITFTQTIESGQALTLTDVPIDDAYTYDSVALRVDQSLLAGNAWASALSEAAGMGVPTQRLHLTGIAGYEDYCLPNLQVRVDLAGDDHMSKGHILWNLNFSQILDEAEGFAPHFRGQDFVYYIGRTGKILNIAPSGAPIVLAFYDSISGDWFYSTSEVPAADEYAAPLLTPGAHSITLPGGVTITHWAVFPMRGQMSNIYVGERIGCEALPGGGLGLQLKSLVKQDGIYAAPGNSLTPGRASAVFTEASLGWTTGGTFTVEVDTEGDSGLGTDTYTITIVP